MKDKIATGATKAAKGAGEIGKGVLKTGAGFIAPAAVIGVIAVGFKKMFGGFKK